MESDCSREAASGRKPVQRDHRRAVGLVARQARTLKAALEHRIGTRVPPDARILCWLVAFAAYLMNRCVGSDGKTPLQRLHGRRDNTPILEFGEKILYMPGQASEREKVGTAIPSWSVCGDAELVIRGSGRHRARNGDQDTLGEHRRIPESERWDADRILGIRAVPWSPDGSDNAFDIQVGMERPAEMVPRDPGEVLMENKVARTYLRRADFEQGVKGCPGCRYLRTGQERQQAHSEACRRRIEGLLKGDPVGSARLAAADERINRALADAVERLRPRIQE